MKKVTIILPAHNEEKIIKDSINSLLNQSYCNLEIITVLDNCTDNTELIINSNFEDETSVKIFKTVNNRNKKSGALNQLFNYYFDNMGEYILIMDADTVLDKNAVAEGVKFLDKYIKYGVVCSKAGVIEPKKKTFMWHIQNIEYGQFDTDRIETQGFCMVAHGMFSMYKKEVLKKVKVRSCIYDENCITEDYELTLAVKSLGYKIGNNLKIKAYTDVPMTLKEYWIQRIRWMTGGLNALSKYSFNRYTYKDKIGHLLFLILFSLQLFLVTSAIITKTNLFGFGIIVILSLSLINSLLRYKYATLKNRFTLFFVIILIPDIFLSWIQTMIMIKSWINYVFKINLNWR
jgi:cellulose synthase/poly-beta-1,6-N-acetylglucosamine synthase-like glycosyltransferase